MKGYAVRKKKFVMKMIRYVGYSGSQTLKNPIAAGKNFSIHLCDTGPSNGKTAVSFLAIFVFRLNLSFSFSFFGDAPL